MRCATGLPGAQFATPDKALDARTIGHNPERLSLLQGGIVYANQVGSELCGNRHIFTQPELCWLCLTVHCTQVQMFSGSDPFRPAFLRSSLLQDLTAKASAIVVS